MKKIILLSVLLCAYLPVYSESEALDVVKKTGSVLLGVPFGAFAGLSRGALNKSSDYASKFSTNLGDNTPAKILGYPSGIIVGGLAGGLSGAVKGVINGIYYGSHEPFSSKSFTVDGNFSDFDPFDYSNKGLGSKRN